MATTFLRPLFDGYRFVSLAAAAAEGIAGLDRAPRTIRILAENLLRHADPDQALAAVARLMDDAAPGEINFRPARVLLQDHSGIPVLADLAALASLLAERGIDARTAAPALPVTLVVDHSVEAHAARQPGALAANLDREYALNGERFRFLKWAQQAFPGLRIVPPGHGIVHQMHLEYVADIVSVDDAGVAVPDTVLGTDSHTPMVNALGVLGWGVGGIEATAALLGDPVSLLVPDVIGIRLAGCPAPGVLAMDIALAMTRFLRALRVVGTFVEFFGPGVEALGVPDRATIANMAPEYGCTVAFFPTDAMTLDYLRRTARPPGHVELVEAYTREQGLFSDEHSGEPSFRRSHEFDLGAVEPGVAGPRRPQDGLAIAMVGASFPVPERVRADPSVDAAPAVPDGAVAIAAITSCTNTSNPTSMVTAGLLARRAVALGLTVPDWVKTSLAPGSRAVSDYLRAAGLLDPLTALGFDLVGYGCTTCIGNSGALRPAAAAAVAHGRQVAAVLSGNRNFAGRIHQSVAAAYLMSPPLVVAFALAGTIHVDLSRDPIGTDQQGRPVTLNDLWPDTAEVAIAEQSVSKELFAREREDLYVGDDRWAALAAPIGPIYDWPDGSTYLVCSPFVDARRSDRPADLRGARALVVAPDTTTTDYISPAGAIPPDSLAGQWLRERGVPPGEFNSYGCRRGNHEVLVRGTFAGHGMRNGLVPSRAGGWTRHLPDGEVMTVYDAARAYAAESTPLVVLAGRDYGMGSSRDWAAKGPRLLGVRAVLAESFERIHRSNLVGMGIVPLQFGAGSGIRALRLTGEELYDIDGLADLVPRGDLTVRAFRDNGELAAEWRMTARVDTEQEVMCVRRGGLLPAAAQRLAGETPHG